MFVQFVSLCYYEYFSEEIRKLKFILENDIKSGELTNAELKLTKKLNNWVNNTPLYLQLQWFDTVEQVNISSKPFACGQMLALLQVCFLDKNVPLWKPEDFIIFLTKGCELHFGSDR